MPSIYVQFETKLNLIKRFRSKKVQNFMKTHPMTAKFLHVARWMTASYLLLTSVL